MRFTRYTIPIVASAAALLASACGSSQPVVKAPAHKLAAATPTPDTYQLAAPCLNVQGKAASNHCFQQATACSKLRGTAATDCSHYLTICNSTTIRKWRCFGKPEPVKPQRKRIQMYVNGMVNDDFYNVCIKNAKEITSFDHGNYYCQ